VAVPFINGLAVDDATGRANVSTSTPTGVWRTGLRYASDNTLYVITGSVPVGAPVIDGWARITDSGALCVLIDSPPSAPNRRYNDGILGDDAGHVCLTTTNAIANWNHGWPVDSIGQVCVTGSAPPVVLIDTVDINYTQDEGAINYYAQLYFGVSGSSSGEYSSQSAFVADHPGLTLNALTGIAPANGRTFPVTSLSSGAITIPIGQLAAVSDTGWFVTNSPFVASVYCTLSANGTRVTMTFSPAINSFGMFFATNGSAISNPTTVAYYNGGTGGTLLHTTSVAVTIRVDVFTQFTGYSVGS
jgi:hypothetical protein